MPTTIAAMDPDGARGGVPGEARAPPLPRPTWRGACRSSAPSSRASTAATRPRSGRTRRDGADLEQRLLALPGIGEMKARTMVGVLAKRLGVRPTGWEEFAPQHECLGDVDSPQALADYQAAKRAHKAALRARSAALTAMPIELRTLTDGGQTPAEIAARARDVPRRRADEPRHRPLRRALRDRRRRARPRDAPRGAAARRRDPARLQRRPPGADPGAAAAGDEARGDRGAARADARDRRGARPDAPQVRRPRRHGRVVGLDELDRRLVEPPGERDRARARLRPSSRARSRSTSTSSGSAARSSTPGRVAAAAGRRSTAASRCGRGSRRSTATRSRIGSRSSSAGRRGGSGSPRPVLTSGPILATLVEIVNEHRCDVAGVIDETQVDEVFHQWATNGVSAWKIPLLHTIADRRRRSPASCRPRGRPSRCTTSCTRRSSSPTTSPSSARSTSRARASGTPRTCSRSTMPAIADRLATLRRRGARALPADDAAPDRGMSGEPRSCRDVTMRIVVARNARRSQLWPRRPPGRRRSRRRSRCPVFPADNAWNRRVDTLPVAAGLGGDRRRDRRDEDDARRLRLGPLGRRPDRDPDHRRRQGPAARAGPLRVRRRVRPRPVPDSRRRADRGRRGGGRRPACADRRPRRLPALRALRAAPGRRPLDGRLGRDLGPALEPAAARRLDVGRRRRAADPARPRALRRGRQGRIDHALRFTVSRTQRAYVWPARHCRELAHRSGAAADGRAAPAQARLRHLGLPAAGAGRAPGAEGVRDDRGRQRLRLVRLRRARPALVERRPPHARPRARVGLRGRRHLVASATDGRERRSPTLPPPRGTRLHGR